MRVSTLTRFDTTLDSLQRRQGDLVQAQEQMATGKRVSRPSDDPTSAARAERAYIVQQRNESEQRSVAASRSAMAVAESSIGSAGDLMQAVRLALVSAGNGSFSAGDRRAVAVQIEQLRSQLLSVANQSDGAGGFIYGGQGTVSAPFVDSAAGVAFAGTGGQIQLSTREQLPTTVDGQAIWLSARSGNGVFTTAALAGNGGQGWIDSGGVVDPSAITASSYDIVFSVAGGVTTYSVLKDGAATAVAGAPYVPGDAITIDGMALRIKGQPADGDTFTTAPSMPDLDPFDAIDRALAVLNDASAGSGQVSQSVSDGIRDLDALLGHFQAARSVAGAALSRLDAITLRNEERNVIAKTIQSDAEDLDMVKAISDFQNRQTNYQAALQSYAMVQRMTLFDYLK